MQLLAQGDFITCSCDVLNDMLSGIMRAQAAHDLFPCIAASILTKAPKPPSLLWNHHLGLVTKAK